MGAFLERDSGSNVLGQAKPLAVFANPVFSIARHGKLGQFETSGFRVSGKWLSRTLFRVAIQ